MNEIAITPYHDRLDQVEAIMHEMGAKEFELGDFFCGGMYIRPVIVEAGDELVSKIHGVEHPFFLMAGKIVVIDEDGEHEINAPHIDITLPGTRRYARAIERCLWVTVHRTDKLTVDEVEKEVIIPHENKLLINNLNLNECLGSPLA